MNEGPTICENCLGTHNDIRMTKVLNGAQCKICILSFTLFHFKQSERAGTIIKTIICNNCATQRHVCQCCMLDLTWHIPIKQRDQIVSLIQENDSMTPEAKNVMMKRFLSLKKEKLGGAKVTSDADALQLLIQKLKGSIMDIEAKIQQDSKTVENSKDPSRLNHIDISHILQRLPLSQSMQENVHSKSFFLYNIDGSIPEWKISDTIAKIINNDHWQENDSNSLVVNHKAGAGGIRFKDDSTGDKFVKSLIEHNDVCNINDNKGNILQRGILKIDHFQIFVIPWKSGFSTSSFGKNSNENSKLFLSLKKLVKLQSSNIKNNNDVNDKTVKTKTNKITKNKKKTKKSKRITSLNL